MNTSRLKRLQECLYERFCQDSQTEISCDVVELCENLENLEKRKNKNSNKSTDRLL